MPIVRNLTGGTLALNAPFLWSPKSYCISSPLCGPYITITIEPHAEGGDHLNRGPVPDFEVNQDYSRAGGAVGFDLAVKNWYDLTVTDTNLYGFIGRRRDLNDFQASLSLYFGSQNMLGLTLSYKNGLAEQTAQREQSWTVGLTVKY